MNRTHRDERSRWQPWALAGPLVAAAIGCSSNSAQAPAGQNSARSEPTPPPAIELCIDIDDLQIEPLDLEALDDETPAPGAALAELLAGLAAHGAPVPLDPEAGTSAVPFVRCPDPARTCQAGVMTVDAAAKELATTPLPGLDEVAPKTAVDMVSAPADVNSDGAAEMWIGYRRGDPATAPSEHHVAVMSLPELTLQWHGVVARSSPEAEGQGCDGALYPVDADCDSDGDLILVQRCGPMKCLNDDSTACDPDAITERVTAHAWDGPSYAERSLPSPAGSKP